MKLSPETLLVLQNFQSINPSIILEPGKFIGTVNDVETIVAEATVNDDFPQQFGIYDLAQFINNVTTLGAETDITFDEYSALFKNNGFEVSYRAASTNLITGHPGSELPMDEVQLEVILEKEGFKKFLKLAQMNNLREISLDNRSGVVYICAEDDNDSSNKIEHKLGETSYDDFRIKFETANFKMIPGSYKVTANENFGKFERLDGDLDLRYYIIAQS